MPGDVIALPSRPCYNGAVGTADGRQRPLSPNTRQEDTVNAEVITIGTELLLGDIVDTNAVHIARQLRTIGLDLHYITTVGDNLERIARVVDDALNRVDVVITTGGLGPTVDDVTREAVAKATGRPLVLNPELLSHIEAFFARLGRTMQDNNRRQAYIPEGAIPIPNPVGTAPAFIVETARGVVITLPGVPREMKYLLEHAVLPYLQQRFDLHQVIKSKILRTVAIGESDIDHRIADLMTASNPTVGLAAHAGQTDIRITAKAASEEEADRLIAQMEAQVRERLGDAIYGEGTETVEEVVAQLLQQQGWTLALAQSGPDSHIASRLEEAGITVLRADLPLPTLQNETDARAWARRVRADTGADLALVISAAASETEEGGDTYIAAASPAGEKVIHLPYTPLHEYRKRWVANIAMNLVRLLALTS